MSEHPSSSSIKDAPQQLEDPVLALRLSSSSVSSSSIIETKIPRLQKIQSSRHRPTCAAEELMVIGGVLTNLGKYVDAQECYDKAYQVFQDHLLDHDSNDKEDNFSKSVQGTIPTTGNIETYPDGTALVNLAHLSTKCEKFDEARELYSRALEQHYNVHGNDPKTAFAGEVWSRLGRLAAKQKQYHEAFCYFEKALEIKIVVYGGQDTNPQNDDLATTLECMGNVTGNLQKYTDSLKYYKRSLKMYYTIHGSPHLLENKRNLKAMSSKFDTLGRLSQMTGEYDASRIFYDEALMLKGELYGFEACNLDICTSLNALGNLHRILGEYEHSRKYFIQELHMLHRIYGQEAKTKEIANTLHSLGNLHCSLNRFSKADDYYKQALDMKLCCFGPAAKNMSLATTLHSLGILANELGRYKEAELYFIQALEMKQHVYGKDAKNASIANTINRCALS
jgi:tetratricopeptide (TPR) repeat protein